MLGDFILIALHFSYTIAYDLHAGCCHVLLSWTILHAFNLSIFTVKILLYRIFVVCKQWLKRMNRSFEYHYTNLKLQKCLFIKKNQKHRLGSCSPCVTKIALTIRGRDKKVCSVGSHVVSSIGQLAVNTSGPDGWAVRVPWIGLVLARPTDDCQIGIWGIWGSDQYLGLSSHWVITEQFLQCGFLLRRHCKLWGCLCCLYWCSVRWCVSSGFRNKVNQENIAF